MGMPMMWLLRLFTLFGFLSLTLTHPLGDSLVRDDIIIRNTTQVSNDTGLIPQNNIIESHKRALRGYTEQEQKQLRGLSKSILRELEPKTDIVYFVGNAGAYLMSPFDDAVIKKYNMAAIPYDDDRSRATNAGNEKYWTNVLAPPLMDKNFQRIVIVGNFKPGESDRFREYLLEACETGYAINFYWMGHPYWKEHGQHLAETMSRVPVHLFNVLDQGDGLDKPKYVKLVRMFDIKGAVVKKLLDNKGIYELQPYYPRSKWEKDPRKCWSSDNNKQNSKLFRESIITWNKNNGGLVGGSKDTGK